MIAIVEFTLTPVALITGAVVVAVASKAASRIVTPEASNVSNKNSAVVEISDLADFVTTNTLQKEAVEITSKLKK